MKLKYQHCKGLRVKGHKFLGVDCKTQNYWWVEGNVQKWMHGDSIDPNNHPSYCTDMWPCRSVRAFRRRLKQWSKYMAKGTQFTLVSRYVGHNIKGRV